MALLPLDHPQSSPRDEAALHTMPILPVLGGGIHPQDPPIVWTRTVPAVPPARQPAVALRPRRASAPLGLRLFVGGLSLVLCAGLGVLSYGRAHPPWLVVPRARTVVTAERTTSTMALVSATPNTVTYRVPSGTYEIGLVIPARCWTVITSTGHPGAPVLARVLEPSASPQWFAVSGSSTIVVDARTTEFLLRSGDRLLGTVETPTLGRTYAFEPATLAPAKA